MLFYLYLFISLIADLMVAKIHQITRSPAALIRFVLTFAGIYAICLLCHLLIMILLSVCFDRRSHIVSMNTIFRKASMATLNLIIKIARIKVTVTGAELLPQDRRFLLVGNHLSAFDPMVAMYYFRKELLAFVSKKENVEIPFVGRLMLACGCLPLDRENVRAAAVTINDAAELIKSGLASVGIYPEGKVNKTDDPLLPFRNGAFKIAKKAKAPIVVTTITNTNKVRRRWPFRRTDVQVDILAVIQPEEFQNLSTVQLGNAVWEVMQKHLSELA